MLDKVYVFYFNFYVGVVVKLEDGSVLSGVNFENVVYFMCFCVEWLVLVIVVFI